jgi:MraZ protein
MTTLSARQMTVDEQGRVIIPADFRELLHGAGHVYITNYLLNGERCLTLFPPDQWDQFLAKFKDRRNPKNEANLKNPRLRKNVQHLETFVVGGAHKIPIDVQGRILIPPKLRKFAGLSKNVTLSATSNRFELWDQATFEKHGGGIALKSRL